MMKRLLILLTLCCCTVFAETININWIVDGQQYGTPTTCEYSGDVILPTPPTKYGYTFAGWEPRNYIFLEYIESTGPQYIDTKIIPTSSMTLWVKWQYIISPATDYFPLGCRNTFNDGVTIFSGNYGFATDWFGEPADVDRYHFSDQINTGDLFVYYVEDSLANMYKNGVSLYSHQFTPSTSTNYSLFVNAINSSSPKFNTVPARIYGLKISNKNNTLINLIPAKRVSDNAIGMYDLVSGTFFENAGTGTFIAGPVVQ